MSPQQKNNTSQYRLTFGKYVLDSLSVGMYSHPLMAIREYIQNSADAIDYLPGLPDSASIDVVIDGRKRSLSIRDNGAGIPCDKARGTLLNVGCSEKDPTLNRGFRGIGRLGGLGYCDELRFITKSQGEDMVSVCTWGNISINSSNFISFNSGLNFLKAYRYIVKVIFKSDIALSFNSLFFFCSSSILYKSKDDKDFNSYSLPSNILTLAIITPFF